MYAVSEVSSTVLDNPVAVPTRVAIRSLYTVPSHL